MFKMLLLVAGLLALPFTTLAADTVDINTADHETLVQMLNGIGAARADAIIAYRENNGPFMSVEELTEVRGIGPSILEKNRDILAIKPAKPAADMPAADMKDMGM